MATCIDVVLQIFLMLREREGLSNIGKTPFCGLSLFSHAFFHPWHEESPFWS